MNKKEELLQIIERLRLKNATLAQFNSDRLDEEINKLEKLVDELVKKEKDIEEKLNYLSHLSDNLPNKWKENLSFTIIVLLAIEKLWKLFQKEQTKQNFDEMLEKVKENVKK